MRINLMGLTPVHICLVLLLVVPAVCLASGGRVIYPDGTPAEGAQVKLLSDNETTVRCDARGRFSIPVQTPGKATVQVKAPDGRDHATVNLPAQLFSEGEVAIVLQQAR
jgi:hypothetical protein